MDLRIMRIAITIVLCLIVWVGFCACGSNEDVAETTTSVPTYEASLEVDCIPNLLFNKYDISIIIDEGNVGTLEHGKKETFRCELTEGKHEVSFQEEEDQTVDGVATINVTKDGNNSFAFQIICYESQIDVEIIDKEKEAAEAAAKKKREEDAAAAAAAAESIDKLIGKLIGKAPSVSNETGYKFKYIDLTTDKDITESIEADADKYKEWRIMDTGTIDAKSKTAELYVLNEKEAAAKAAEKEIDLSSVHKTTKTEINKADGNPTFRIYSNVKDTKENEENFYADATLLLADHYDITEKEAAKIIKKVRAGESVIRGDTHIFSSTSSGETYGIFMYTEFFHN